MTDHIDSYPHQSTPSMSVLYSNGYTEKKIPIQDGLVDDNNNNKSNKWDPRSLLNNKLYKVDYNPFLENRPRFRNMEGHLEIPVEEENIVPPVEKPWKKLYFRTKDGRFQWFANHFADDHPISDVLLTGTTITANKDDWTLKVNGGKENANITVRAPSNVFEKWRQALLSHSNSALIDAYVQPIYPPVPHYNKKVVLIELGTCSIRGGLLSQKPSLPLSFFPAVACVSDSTSSSSDVVFAVGIDSFNMDIRQKGHFESPLQASNSDNTVERYKFNSAVLEACIWKVVNDIQNHARSTNSTFDPTKHKVLLSVPQDIPSIFIGNLLRTLLKKEFGFQGASIARQPSLILYSYDVTTGVVVDVGERLSIVPVIDEFIVESAIVCLPFGAQQIRECLRRRLDSQNNAIYGANYNSMLEQIMLRSICEQVCYLASDYDEEVSDNSKNGSVSENAVVFDVTEVPPGMDPTLRIDNTTRFHVTEGLFKPKQWNLEMNGIHHLIHNSIQQCPIDSRRTLYRNIYLAGGISLLPGLAERLEQELCRIAPQSIFVQVHGSPWRYHSAYLGIQVVAKNNQFDKCCATRENIEQYIRQLENGLN